MILFILGFIAEILSFPVVVMIIAMVVTTWMWYGK